MLTGSMDQFHKPYDPSETETRWYRHWEEQGYFGASNAQDDDRPTYTIVIPPPNVTGSLHMGHACRTTFEDVLVRYHRMTGKNALWLPGIDHAGIATQVVVERQLKAEGLSRHGLGRDAFVERIWQWKGQSGGRILQQLRRMGASCDWDRTRFTMDPALCEAVKEAFVRLFEEGLIYRGKRMVNWDVATQTVLSDLEVETEEQVSGTLFHFAYRVEETDHGELVVATTRPETMLGDTAVAVHPDDERYQHLHGKSLRHPFVDRLVPIITDGELVNPEFGTGAVKVTPAHDFNDFATGERHGLEVVNVLNLDGTLNALAGPFCGLERFKARVVVVEALQERGLFRGEFKHIMSLPRSQRSGVVVEPMVSTQWFVRMAPLAKPAIEAVDSGEVRIVPEEWNKTYFHWMRNIEDWCISRQLWWGHPIPAWHCGECGEVNVAREAPERCASCGSTNLTRDPDVLDTWFSSALWPFSTLGWPDNTADLRKFYPTQDLETGYDILFFWVARMIMMGLHFMGQVPFNRVLLSGMVTDERGEKMSKVKGNVIDPLDVIDGATVDALVDKAKRAGARDSGIRYLRKTYPDGFSKYGADALRMTLLSYSPNTKRIALSIKRIEGYRNFANKLWNAARFCLISIQDVDVHVTGRAPTVKALPNRWILSRLEHAVNASVEGLEEYRVDDSALALYHFVWDEFCDWYLELCKGLLSSGDEDVRQESAQTLVHCMDVVLRAMHPMMPFITEEIWQCLPHGTEENAVQTIMRAPYPSPSEAGRRDEESEMHADITHGLVTAVRAVRSTYHLSRKTPIRVHIVAESEEVRRLLEDQRPVIELLCTATVVSLGTETPSTLPSQAAETVSRGARCVISLEGLVDPEKEKERLARVTRKAEKDLLQVQKKLENPNFLQRAPKELVEQEKLRLEELQQRLGQLKQAAKSL